MTLVTILIALLLAAFFLYLLRRLLPIIGVPANLVDIILGVIAFAILVWLLTSVGLLPNIFK